jgi:hypothetical protein
MALALESSHRTEVAQKSVSPLSDPRLTQVRQGEAQDFLERGFALAHFIFPERPTAIAILVGALNKLKARLSRERKRTYWRDKFLKRQITRITRDDEDTLQWLIYFESDSHEKAQERRGQASEQDFVIRYVKTLVRLSTGMSSFYVNIAIHRLLYRYTTSEAQKIYEMVTDSYREADEYRRAKRLLMLNLESRFQGRIQSVTTDRGEARYELAENQERWRDLVMSCLELFKPWSTQNKCPLKDGSGIFPSRLRELFSGNCEGSGNQDKIEIKRCHAFIDPLCSGYIVQALGLEQHSSRLGVPRFDMAQDQNGRLPSLRIPDTPLTAQERQAIADALAAEEARRRKVVARELRLVVDGVEHARWYPEHSRELRFHAPLGCQLLEVWTADEQGPLLLATHIIPIPDSAHPVESRFALPLMGGRSVSICALHAPDGETSPCTISVSIDGTEVPRRPVASRVQAWLARAPALPAYAGMLALLLAVIFLWTGLRQKLATEQLRENDLRTELARDREARASSQQPPRPITGPSAYRLTPDDLITRGSDEIQEHAITVPPISIVITLELPVSKAQGQYHAVLKPLDGRKIILAEDELSPIVQGSEKMIVVSVPSTLLAPSQYYRVDLQGTISRDVRTFTFYTTPAQP